LMEPYPKRAFFSPMGNTEKYTPSWIVVLKHLALSIVNLTNTMEKDLGQKQRDYDNGLMGSTMLSDKLVLQIGYALVLVTFALMMPKVISIRAIRGKRYSILPIDLWLKEDGIKHASFRDK